jgi:hypothetical protein
MEQDPDLLKEIIDDISALELVKVAIPMGVEVALYLKDKSGNPVVKLPDDFNLNMEEIKSSDFSNDVKKLGYAFVDISTLYKQKPSTNNPIDYLNFDPELVKSILNSISDTDTIKAFAPIAISYVATIDTIEASLNKIGFSAADFGLNDVESWGKEFKQFGEIYEAVAALQIKSFSDKETFEYVTEEKIGLLSSSIFESVILANATPLLVKTLSDGVMPPEYKDLIVVDSSIWNENEFNAVINAVVSLLKSGIMNAKDDVFASLTDATINDLAKYLSKSKFITSNLNTITESFSNGFEFLDNTNLITLKTDEWTELEIKSLFKSISMIVSEGVENLINLEDDKIVELSGHIARSKFITRNFDTILDTALADIELGDDVEFGTYDNWEDVEASESELYNLFKSAKIIKSKGSDINAFTSLNDSELDVFLNSEYISETLVNVLQSLSQEGKKLDLLVGVDNPDVKWYDNNITSTTFTIVDHNMNIVPVDGANKYNIYADGIKIASTRSLKYPLEVIDQETVYTVEGFEEGELRRMFRALGSIADNLTGDGGFTTDTITNLTDDEIDNIIVSDILVLSLVKKLEDMKIKDPNTFVVIPEGTLTSQDETTKLNAWKNTFTNNQQREGELSKSLKGLRFLLAGVDIENFDISSITALTEEQITVILKSDVLSESIIVQIEKLDDDPESVIAIPSSLSESGNRDPWKNEYVYDLEGKLIPNKFGELHKSLRALKIIVKDGNIENIDVNNILDQTNQQIVLDSQIVEETIINKIIVVAEGLDSVIKIPNNIKNAPDNTVWKQTENGEGELRKLLKAFEYLMGEDGSINQFNFDIGIVIEDQNEILKSDIIVETIIHKLSGQIGINIPTGIAYGLADPDNRSEWKNQYTLDENNNYVYQDGKVVVTKPGELSRLLNAVDIIILPDELGNKSLENINFNVEVAFNDDNQETLLKSYIISETIVNKIIVESEENKVLELPDEYYLNTLDDSNDYNRSDWYNYYDKDGLLIKGEIAHLLDAVEALIGEGGSFTGINFDINNVFNSQETILKSKIISETIVQKILSNTEAIPDSTFPSIDLMNRPFEDSANRSAWFNEYSGEAFVKKNELGKFLDAVHIVLGDGLFESMEALTIDKILDLGIEVEMNTETKVVTSSSFKVLLDSVIIENIIGPLLLNVATVTMAAYLQEPENDNYHFLKSELIINYDLSTFTEERYDAQSFLDSLYLMKRAGFDYNNLGIDVLTKNNENLADAMVASRVFKGSIAKMFNPFIQTFYENPLLPPLLVDPLRYKKALDDVKINQTVYNDLPTPLDAHIMLVEDLINHKNYEYYYE